MNKIYKKIQNIDQPVLIGGNNASPARTLKTASVTQSDRSYPPFQEAINSEIENWKRKIELIAESSRIVQQKESEAAYKEGYAKGLAHGIEKERENRYKSIEMLFTEAKRIKRNAIRDLEVKIIELAVIIAEKITRKSIDTDPAIVENIVTETLSNIISSENVILKISSEDYPAINAKYEKWLNMAGNAAEFRIEINKRLMRGDCLIETEGGVIDAIVANRIEILVDELLKANR